MNVSGLRLSIYWVKQSLQRSQRSPDFILKNSALAFNERPHFEHVLYPSSTVIKSPSFYFSETFLTEIVLEAFLHSLH